MGGILARPNGSRADVTPFNKKSFEGLLPQYLGLMLFDGFYYKLIALIRYYLMHRVLACAEGLRPFRAFYDYNFNQRRSPERAQYLRKGRNPFYFYMMHNKGSHKKQKYKSATSARLPFGRAYEAPHGYCIGRDKKRTSCRIGF